MEHSRRNLNESNIKKYRNKKYKFDKQKYEGTILRKRSNNIVQANKLEEHLLEETKFFREERNFKNYLNYETMNN